MNVSSKWCNLFYQHMKGVGQFQKKKKKKETCVEDQWQNRRGRGWLNRWAQCPPNVFTGKFLLTNREKRGKEKRENGEDKKENSRRKEENVHCKGKRYGMKLSRGRHFFFFFFFFAWHFLKPLKFVWVLPKRKFLPGENSISRREKIRKSNFAPPKKYSFYASVEDLSVSYIIDRVTSVFINKWNNKGWGTGLFDLFEQTTALSSGCLLLLLYEMLGEFKKHWPWASHDAHAHSWALTSPVTPSIVKSILCRGRFFSWRRIVLL